LGALIGVLGSLLVALANSLLNRGKFKRELLWEKRQAACNEIVSSLQGSSRLAYNIEEGFAEDAHSFYESKELERLNSVYGEQIASAHAAFQANYLILPAAFRKRYERLEKERANVWYYAAGPDVYLDQIAANERARRDLFDLARAELGIVPWWKRSLIRWRPSVAALPEAASRRWKSVRRRFRRWQRGSDF
jgi:hypothetical protein